MDALPQQNMNKQQKKGLGICENQLFQSTQFVINQFVDASLI